MATKIETERLILRTIEMDDAKIISKLCNDKAIAATTLSIPHPYSLEDARKFIEVCVKDCDKIMVFTIILKSTNEITGTIGLKIEQQYERAELGYWVGKPYWNNGYCTEATRAVLEYGFIQLKLHRIYAFYTKGNEASGKIMRKLGMQYEGRLKDHIKKDGIFQDLELYAILSTVYKEKFS